MVSNAIIVVAILVVAFAFASITSATSTTTTTTPNCSGNNLIIGQKLYVNCNRVFLKTGVITNPFAWRNDAAINDAVNHYKQKDYNALDLDLYWDQFDKNGDGQLDSGTWGNLNLLNKWINEINNQGLYVVVSFETYNVGGGGTPDRVGGFFDTYGTAVQARNENFNLAFDTEYGTNKKIPSIFNQTFLNNSRKFMQNILKGIDNSKVLYYKTTVEPQYIGNQFLDYSDNSKVAYLAAGGSWPPAITDTAWNNFRAKSLADWVNGDVRAIKEVVPNALVGVDYLNTVEREPSSTDMRNRAGNSTLFLSSLEGVNILRLVPTWEYTTNTRYGQIYDIVKPYAQKNNWAITEHQTLINFPNANSILSLTARLLYTLQKGNRFGWDVNVVMPDDLDSGAVYYGHWISNATFIGFTGNWTNKTEYIGEFDQNSAYWINFALAYPNPPTTTTTTTTTTSPPSCTLTSVSMTPQCTNCRNGDAIKVNVTYTGSCPANSYIQVDASSSDNTCRIFDQDRSNCPINSNAITGINVQCTSSPCSATWQIPNSIPSNCLGKTVTATAASIRNNYPCSGGTGYYSYSPTGSFTFYSPATSTTTTTSTSSTTTSSTTTSATNVSSTSSTSTTTPSSCHSGFWDVTVPNGGYCCNDVASSRPSVICSSGQPCYKSCPTDAKNGWQCVNGNFISTNPSSDCPYVGAAQSCSISGQQGTQICGDNCFWQSCNIVPTSTTTTLPITSTTTTTTKSTTTYTTSSTISSTTTTTIPITTTIPTTTTSTTPIIPTCDCSWFVCNQYCGSKSGNYCLFDSSCIETTSTTTSATTTISSTTNTVTSTTSVITSTITSSTIITTTSATSTTTPQTSTTTTTITPPAQPCRTYDIPCWIGYFILRIFGLAK